jgi:hypothetical protein
MARFEHITKGTRIDTLAGYIILKDRNDGGLYDADEYTINEHDETEFTGAVRLTKAEIERTMKEMDGKNHSVIWEGETE